LTALAFVGKLFNMSDLPKFRKVKKQKFSKFNNQKGQALLIILLLMSVILTIVLSVSSRSVTEITISKSEEDSVRALSAAEAGVEEVLISGTTSSGTLTNDSSYSAEVRLLDSVTGEFVYPNSVRSGEPITFWFVSHNDAGDLICTASTCFQGDNSVALGSSVDVCWGEPGISSALELTFYYDPDTTNKNWEPPQKDFSGVNIKRFAYDDPASGKSNNFSSAEVGSSNCAITNNNFAFSTPRIDLSDVFSPECNPDTDAGCILMARIRLFYNGIDKQPVGIIAEDSTTGLPAQGALIDSTGEYFDATRKISVFRSYPSPPGLFDSAVFSYGSITK
jgi:hypothetical protein